MLQCVQGISFVYRLVHAFDKDPRRFAVLKERLKQAGATCVSPVLSDFLQVQHDQSTVRIIAIATYYVAQRMPVQ